MTTIIDLGEDRTLPEQERHRPRTPAVRAGLAVALLLCLALGGGAPARPGLQRLLAVPAAVGAAYLLNGDIVYISQGGRFSAYRLPAGKHIWTVPLPARIESLFFLPAAGALIGQSWNGPDGPSVTVLDIPSGRTLWHAPGVTAASDQTHVVLDVAAPVGRTAIQVRDTRSGREIWSRRDPSGAARAVSGGQIGAAPDRMVFQQPDGTTEVVDDNTGHVVVRRALPPLSGPGAGGSTGFGVAGDHVYLARQAGDSSLLDAYDLGTLDHLWRVRLTPPAYDVAGCGPVLCVRGEDSLSGVDPATGRVRWTSRTWTDGQPLPGGRLLVSDGSGSSAVVDARTLRTLADLHTWSAVFSSTTRVWLLSRRDTVAPSRTWFAWLDPAGSVPRPLDWLTDVDPQRCVATDRYLVCPVSSPYRVQVWRYRPTLAG